MTPRSLPALSWPRPNIAVIGYALYLAINATSLWGGVFPFFPEEFHSPDLLLQFALAQSLAFSGTMAATVFLSYLRPDLVRRALIFSSGAPLAAGACLLVAGLYLPDAKPWLIPTAGVLVGMGGAGFALAWQRYFSSKAPDRGNFLLLAGTACAPAVYLTFYLIPIAVTVYLIPLIFVPLCGLCAMLATRTIDFRQPIFEDVPREHPRTYLRVMGDSWRAAVAVGSLGFASGIIRATALSSVAMGDAVNIASMAGALGASAVLLLVWRHGSVEVNLEAVFLALFPLAACCLAAYPFFGPTQMMILAGAIYLVFSFANLAMMLHCAQASRDRGVNPVFLFSFFGTIVYLVQDAGFVFGSAANVTGQFGYQNFFIIAMAGLIVLALALYLLRGGLPIRLFARGVEGPAEAPRPAPRAGASPPRAASAGDEMTLRCRLAQDRFRLTSRECEIMEAIVRGNTVARTAEIFVLSENTVRTHTKHIYTKLGVHRKQEMIDVLNGLELEGAGE